MLILNLTILTILIILAIIWYYKKSNKNIDIIIYPDLIHQKYENLDFMKNNEKLFNKVINYGSKKDFISFTYKGYFIDFDYKFNDSNDLTDVQNEIITFIKHLSQSEVFKVYYTDRGIHAYCLSNYKMTDYIRKKILKNKYSDKNMWNIKHRLEISSTRLAPKNKKTYKKHYNKLYKSKHITKKNQILNAFNDLDSEKIDFIRKPYQIYGNKEKIISDLYLTMIFIDKLTYYFRNLYQSIPEINFYNDIILNKEKYKNFKNEINLIKEEVEKINNYL